MKTIFIAVDNLKCGGCGSTISKSLNKINGVRAVTPHIESSTIEISYERIENESIFQNALNKLGYPARGTSNTLQNIKSYMSCAIGKLNH